MSTYPAITAGMSPTSALFQSMLPLSAYKSADQSVTGSTTLVNDSALVVPVAASAKYWFELIVIYTGGTTGGSDIKLAWSTTALTGATMTHQWLISNLSNATQAGEGSYSTTLFCATNGGTVQAATMRGSLATSGAGSLQLMFAQDTSNATPTTVKAGSILMARRVG